MSGWKLGVGAFVLVVGFGLPAKAQGIVPVGMGVTPSGYGGSNPYGQGLSRADPYGANYGSSASSGRAVGAMDPLTDPIRQATRRHRGR